MFFFAKKMVTYEIRKQGHCTTKRTHFHLRFIYSPDGMCRVTPLKKSFRREGYLSLAYFAAPFLLDHTMLHR